MDNTFNCYECDNEFSVESMFETDDQVSFCPYCGSEIEHEEDEDDELDDEDFRD